MLVCIFSHGNAIATAVYGLKSYILPRLLRISLSDWLIARGK
jgi:hypothetical protein